ncbi:hypothetical protein L1011_18085 [Escherichia coli]|uniref:hypothetical protein n=1 Tax=Escherichia coli TaxID=562 RepID=UPI001F2BEB5B|nr:hypothetical protein [Escherichia coli]MCF3209741.1 hypothetical protein [Escherichia coli]
MKIVTRMEAAKAGLNRYFTGKRCRHGHLSERYVLNGTCVECAMNSANRHRNEFACALKSARGENYGKQLD